MSNGLFSKLEELARELKNAQREGESQMETALREIKENLNFQKKIQEARSEMSGKQVQEMSQIVNNLSESGNIPKQKKLENTNNVKPKYRFKDGDTINANMSSVFGANWQGMYNRTILSSLYGFTPDEQNIQTELHRIYTAVPKNEFGFIVKNGNNIPISPLMIEPAN